MNMIIKKEAATLERTSANEGVQLQSLTLSEGTIRFEPDVTDYNVTVAEDVTKILVKGVTNDENSFYTVSGNTNLVKGKNEIVVTVTDKDGNIGHYYIHVQVGEQKEQTSQSDSQSQTNQAAQSVSESVAKPGDENELLSNTVNEFKTFAETVTSGNLQYVTYGVLGCGALAVVLWIAVFIRRAAAKRRYKKERNERKARRKEQENMMGACPDAAGYSFKAGLMRCLRRKKRRIHEDQKCMTKSQRTLIMTKAIQMMKTITAIMMKNKRPSWIVG